MREHQHDLKLSQVFVCHKKVAMTVFLSQLIRAQKTSKVKNLFSTGGLLRILARSLTTLPG